MPASEPATTGSAARQIAPPERIARELARIAARPHADPAERARALLAIALEATGAETAHLASGDGRVSALLDADGAFSWRGAADGRAPHALLDALPGPDDAGAVAVPVHDLAGAAIGALSCGGVGPEDLDPDRIDALTLIALAAAPLLAPPPAAVPTRALAERDLLQAVMEAIPDPIWVKDREGRILRLNAAAEARLRRSSPADPLGRTVADFYSPERAAQIAAQDRRVLAGEPVLNELESEPAGDSTRWRLVTKAPLRGAAGEVTGIIGISRDVTERVVAEHAARAERDLLQTAIDAIPDPIWVKDAEGRFTRLNRAAIERFQRLGLPDAIGRTAADVFDPDFAATVAEQDRAVIATGEPLLNALESEPAGELVRWRLVSKVPLRDAGGAVTGLIGIMRDVTERKDIEDALAGERDLLMTLLDTLPDPVIVRDLAGRVVRMNRAAVADHGLASDAEALGRPYGELLPPERAAEVASTDAAMVASGEPFFNDLQRWDGAGGGRWYLVSKAPFHNLDGETIGLVSTYRDVTALHEAEQALQAERDQLQAILDAIPDWVFLKDAAGRYLRVNQAFAHDFGFASPAEAIGRTFETFTPATVHKGIRDEDAAAVAAAGGVITQVFGTPAADGAVHTYRLVKRTLLDAAGEVSAILGVASDITEIEATRARLAAALEEQREANAELERLNVAKSGIVSMLSHEFRTPLTSIQGYAELIRGYPLDARQVGECGDEIVRGVQRLSELIDDVLELDQVQGGNAGIARQPVALDGVLDDVLRLLAPQATAHELTLSMAAGLPPVLGDDGRLRQVFTNLLGNAVKYSPDGGEIAVAARRDVDMAVVTVRDQGIGIPPDQLEAIFEPYLRLPEAKRRGIVGTGLGLPITRQLVEAMGGTVSARNVPGGSEFAVRLPLAG